MKFWKLKSKIWDELLDVIEIWEVMEKELFCMRFEGYDVLK